MLLLFCAEFVSALLADMFPTQHEEGKLKPFHKTAQNKKGSENLYYKNNQKGADSATLDTTPQVRASAYHIPLKKANIKRETLNTSPGF